MQSGMRLQVPSPPPPPISESVTTLDSCLLGQ